MLGCVVYGALDAVRAACFVGTFTGSCVILCACSPLCLLNAPLRRLGVREERLPSTALFIWCAKAILLSGGVRVELCTAPGQDHPKSRVIFVYNHASNLDPIIVGATCGTAPKFVYKRELAFVPLLGWVLYLYSHIAIDRKNKDRAIASLNAAVAKLVRKNQAVAIAPEGTRSKTGRLIDFKKGPFHMALHSGAQLVPIVIEGAFELCPPRSKWFRAGTVRVTVLPPITPSEGQGVDELCGAVRGAFEAHLGRGSGTAGGEEEEEKKEGAGLMESPRKRRLGSSSTATTIELARYLPPCCAVAAVAIFAGAWRWSAATH